MDIFNVDRHGKVQNKSQLVDEILQNIAAYQQLGARVRAAEVRLVTNRLDRHLIYGHRT